ncbi:hypothetical protein DJ030_17970 [bacterium endosymbiont of Escarpia laminata]|nr:MAG: hypothetical protein DJ030_17970 [bacterium endosymbiont of Escarpia laminata]
MTKDEGQTRRQSGLVQETSSASCWSKWRNSRRFALLHLLSRSLIPFLLFAPTAESAFTDRSFSNLPTESAVSYNISSSDINGDGAPDIFVANRGQNFLLINDGTGLFLDESALRLPTAAAITVDARFADVDGDGDQDLLLANSPTANSLWLNDGTGSFTEAPACGYPQEHGAGHFGYRF